MDLHTAIKHAIDGSAMLFIGSGFSLGAKPIKGEKFLTGTELAKELSAPAGLASPSDDLKFVAQRFRKTLGDEKLVEYAFSPPSKIAAEQAEASVRC